MAFDDEFHRIVRDTYPYPIAFAYRKALGRHSNDSGTVKYVVQAAERVVQFLGLVALSQARHDWLDGCLPGLDMLPKISFARSPICRSVPGPT